MRYTGNEQDDLDLAQKTFARINHPPATFSTWLFTIGTNVCRNLVRWPGRHPTVSFEYYDGGDKPALGENLPAPGDSPSETAERRDLASAAREVIQALLHDPTLHGSALEYQGATQRSLARWGLTECRGDSALLGARDSAGSLLHWKIGSGDAR